MTGPRVAFVMYQGSSHRNHFEALKNYIARSEARIEPVWIPLEEAKPSPLDLPLLGPNSLTRMSRRARRLILKAHQKKPLDAIYFWTYEFAIGSKDLMGRIPTILGLDATVANQRSLESAFPRTHVLRKAIHPLRDYLLRQAVQRAARIVPTSRWAAQSLAEDDSILQNRIEVVPFGVDYTFWSDPVAEKNTAGPFRLLFVGAEVHRKGLDLLVQSCAQLPINSWHLDVVSGDPEACAYASSNVSVHAGLSARSSALRDLFHWSDAFVLPTRWDCTPWVLIEAMASGLPVVASDIGAIGEIVDDGKTGYLVKCGDTDALTDRVTALMFNPRLREQMGLEAQKRARRDFSWHQNYGRLLDAICQASIPAQG